VIGSGGEGIGPGGEAVPEAGWVAPELLEELPGLALRYLVLDQGSGRTPRHVRERLAQLSNRFAGPQAINLRHRPIPWAYRVFFRHIGLDPDDQPTPVEALALERMKSGGFKSQSLLDDALTIAIMESGVAMRAFDADRASGRLGIRPTEQGEELEGRPGALPGGTLVIADEERPLGLLFGATGSGRGVHPRTRRTILAAVQVKGVPDIAVEEAIWLAGGVMRG
jgi:DNA/RNA-binding domain of Phe-tRNA-synthetase-like protein